LFGVIRRWQLKNWRRYDSPKLRIWKSLFAEPVTIVNEDYEGKFQGYVLGKHLSSVEFKPLYQGKVLQ